MGYCTIKVGIKTFNYRIPQIVRKHLTIFDK